MHGHTILPPAPPSPPCQQALNFTLFGMTFSQGCMHSFILWQAFTIPAITPLCKLTTQLHYITRLASKMNKNEIEFMVNILLGAFLAILQLWLDAMHHWKAFTFQRFQVISDPGSRLDRAQTPNEKESNERNRVFLLRTKGMKSTSSHRYGLYRAALLTCCHDRPRRNSNTPCLVALNTLNNWFPLDL